MNEYEENAEQSLDLLEKHIGRFMPDTEYLVEIEPETSLEEHEYGDSFQVDYRLECKTGFSDEGPAGEWEFKGSHLIHGTTEDVQNEYEALISEFEDRFEISDLDYTEIGESL
ncbi:hypothetical protein OB919_15915 [Halobacteria archaeon AArc-curdl1]|uniref:Uncharacterized protein n=1 Tax=Natronosalvus hydrolyticus TaxID=2979988 RepID=A0AAP2Z9Z4_9EURY|nr:hypothetical protein [Halobacteria archaeon AArc-curdl1]